MTKTIDDILDEIYQLGFEAGRNKEKAEQRLRKSIDYYYKEIQEAVNFKYYPTKEAEGRDACVFMGSVPKVNTTETTEPYFWAITPDNKYDIELHINNHPKSWEVSPYNSLYTHDQKPLRMSIFKHKTND